MSAVVDDNSDKNRDWLSQPVWQAGMASGEFPGSSERMGLTPAISIGEGGVM
jgi:hypothetical protein